MSGGFAYAPAMFRSLLSSKSAGPRCALKLAFALVVLLSLVVSGCGRANWIVVHQSKPNALLGQKAFVVAPLEFHDIEMETEHQEVIRNAYNYELRREGQDQYRFVLPEDASSEDIVIETSFYRVDAENSEVDIRVQLTRQGEVLDEFRLESEASYSIFHRSSGDRMSLGYVTEEQRLNQCGVELGENVAQYLDTRTK